eukprot:CAMPEP_0174940244 /NCGR_PEP_ID=MMETSP1355-20121228/68607_1 /TAXON_ID=464990 /ORGANISM="Hemiselmis tepida, Strain CCMP443" /LENGTH=40 /DNA_ID= /DNA_START= /DNA_END= /DNA_ORIENTATION=
MSVVAAGPAPSVGFADSGDGAPAKNAAARYEHPRTGELLP